MSSSALLISHRIRKTLTIQVHLLQSQLDPKEKELSKVNEKMQEISREYDIALHAITEKESNLNQKNENLILLQKQVRSLPVCNPFMISL
jgi:flagellar motility protein MotE (MotC chaperone)